MVLEDLIADRRRVMGGHRPEPKRQKMPYLKLMAAVATGVTLDSTWGSHLTPRRRARLRIRHRSPKFRLARRTGEPLA